MKNCSFSNYEEFFREAYGKVANHVYEPVEVPIIGNTFFLSVMSNPNGDPDADNAPRMTAGEFLKTSNVSNRHRIRTFVAEHVKCEHSVPEHVANQVKNALNGVERLLKEEVIPGLIKYKEALEDKGKGKDNKKKESKKKASEELVKMKQAIEHLSRIADGIEQRLIDRVLSETCGYFVFYNRHSTHGEDAIGRAVSLLSGYLEIEPGNTEDITDILRQVCKHPSGVEYVKKVIAAACYDARVFGLLVPVKGAHNIDFQTAFNVQYGISLHPVTPVPEVITACLATQGKGTDPEEGYAHAGTMGRRYLITAIWFVPTRVYAGNATRNGATYNDLVVTNMGLLFGSDAIASSMKNDMCLGHVEVIPKRIGNWCVEMDCFMGHMVTIDELDQYESFEAMFNSLGAKKVVDRINFSRMIDYLKENSSSIEQVNVYSHNSAVSMHFCRKLFSELSSSGIPSKLFMAPEVNSKFWE